MTKLYNRARVTITSTGTGTLSLGSAVSGYQTFASAGAQNGDVVSYVIEDGLNWEVGTGTFNSAANTLTRTVTQSYNGSTYGTSAISVTTAAQVFISPLAADLQDGTSANQLVRLDGSAKLPAVDGSNLTNVKTPPGGTTGQVQYNAGSNTFGGFTVSGDGALNTSTGALTVTKTNGTSFGALATTTPGTGVSTALAVNTGTAGSIVVNGGVLGTPSSGTLTNCTGLPASTGVTGLAASATTDTTNASNISSGTLAVARGGSGATATTGTGNNVLSASPTFTGTISGDSASLTGTLAMGSSFLRNRIINGDMRIDQRNAGGSVTPSDGNYTVDRWVAGMTASSKYSVQQSTDAPSGFSNSIKITSLSAYTVGAGDTFLISQNIEGFNTADLAFGTASAATITLSFWVKSSLSGTFGGSLENSAQNRSYPFSYNISSTNTWEYKSVTITGDTSGTWVGSTNGIGVRVRYGLGTGSNSSGTAGAWVAADKVQPSGNVQVVATNGATFYITGVQLEVGSVATPFERRQYGQELALCQRYYEIVSMNAAMGVYNSSNSCIVFPIQYKVDKRATPTASLGGTATASNYNVYRSTTELAVTSPTLSESVLGTSCATIGITSYAASTNNYAWSGRFHAGTILFSAEL